MGSSPQTPKKRLVTARDIESITSLLLKTSAEVLDQSHAQYGASIKRWSGAAEKPAGLVVVPTCADEISIVVKFATENNIDLAVKGGGHSTAGASSTNGGLLIDLSRLSYIRVDRETNLLHIGGGATWAEVYDEAWKYGLATVGGTVSDTGVGGLALAGGYGWLSSKYGLTIDIMVEVEIVLADGRVVRCNEKDETDLFWAIKGAGQNFGVVAEFVIRAFSQSDIWGGFVGFPYTQGNLPKVVSAINDIFRSSSLDKNSVTKQHFGGQTMGLFGFMSPPTDEGGVMLMCALFFLGSQEEAKIAYKPLFDIGPVLDTTGMHSWPVANTLLISPFDSLRCTMKGCGFKLPLRVEFVKEVGDEFVQFLKNEDDAGDSLIFWECFEPGEIMKRQGNGCFANRGWHYNGTSESRLSATGSLADSNSAAIVTPIWTKPENDHRYRDWARELAAKFQRELDRNDAQQGGNGTQVRGPKGAIIAYGNHDQDNDKARDVFGDNYPRLQRIKAKYDPHNTFNKLFPITPDAAAS